MESKRVIFNRSFIFETLFWTPQSSFDKLPTEMVHMAQLPCIGLSWLLTKPLFGSCAIYFHRSVV